MSIADLSRAIPKEILIALGLAVLGFIGVALTGVFRKRSIDGPVRFSLEESPRLWLVAAIGFVVWQVGPGLLAVTMTRQTAPASQPSTAPLSQRQAISLDISGKLAAITVMLLLDARLLRDSGRRMGMSARALSHGLFAALPGAVIATLLTISTVLLVQWLWNTLNMHADDHELIRVLRDPRMRDLRYAVYVSAIVLAPLCEEIFFRGHLQSAIRSFTGKPWLSVVIVSIAFALVHSDPWMMPPIMVLSLCLGYVYERTGSLWAPILMHAAFNATSVIMAGFNSAR